jgi:hypothetical protein
VEFAPGGCEGVFVGWVDVTGDGGEVMAVQSVVSYCLKGRGCLRIRPYFIAAAE